MPLLPGYAAIFDDVWESAIAIHVARHFSSPELIRKANVEGLEQSLREAKIRVASGCPATHCHLGRQRSLARGLHRHPSKNLDRRWMTIGPRKPWKYRPWSVISPPCWCRRRTCCYSLIQGSTWSVRENSPEKWGRSRITRTPRRSPAVPVSSPPAIKAPTWTGPMERSSAAATVVCERF